MQRTRWSIMGWVTMLLMVMIGFSQAQEQPVFRIGIVDTARGPISSGAQLAVSQINDAGGVRGADGTFFRLELVSEAPQDDGTLDTAVGTIAQASVIAVIGPETTEAVLGNLGLLQSLGVPVLTPALGDTVIASDSLNLLFRTRAAERLQGAALANYLVTDLAAASVATVQLDSSSTASRVGFSLSLSQIPNAPEESTLPILTAAEDLPALVTQVIDSGAAATATFGPPELAAAFYTQLRENGYVGIFAYHLAERTAFREAVPLEQLRGVLGTTTWPLSSVEPTSNAFLNDFVRAFGRVPGAVEAASYDAVLLLAAAIGQPGELVSNLAQISGFEGVQGLLNPVGLQRGELSDQVAVIQLGALGGIELKARYAGLTRLPDEEAPIVADAPTPTPTLDGTFITIKNTVQNVRTGPGLEYDVLGQLRQGETARVIGATINFDWVVIEFRGQNGWLATYLLDVLGNRANIPVIAPPPTPTPGPATATPTAAPTIDVVVVSVVPTTLTVGVTNNLTVTVQNTGAIAAGAFAVAVTLPPDNTYTSAIVSGLAPGQQTVLTLPALLNSTTGNFSAVVVADLNNEVPESPEGEANNDDFVFVYRVDRPLTLLNNSTLGIGNQLDLEGSPTPNFDIQYTGAGLNTVGVCSATANCIGLISPALNWDTSHYDAITAAGGINTTLIPNTALVPGAAIGILTAEGRRGVLRVDAIAPGVSITLSYRLYQ